MLVVTTYFIGLVALILGLFIDIPHSHSWVMLAWSYPAGAAAGTALGKYYLS